MVAMFESEGVANAPKVIGIFTGIEGWASLHNMMRAFTDADVRAIKNFIVHDRSVADARSVSGMDTTLRSLQLSEQTGKGGA